MALPEQAIFIQLMLTNGSTNLVVDAIGSYLAITFHPQTNELWATSRRAVAPPNVDAVYHSKSIYR